MVFSNGDNYFELSAGINMEYKKKFGRLDLYNLVSSFKCMQVTGIEFKDNKKILFFVLRFQSMVLNTNDVKSVLEEGISTIAACYEEIEQEYFIAKDNRF